MKRLLIGVIASVLVCLFIGDAAATDKLYSGYYIFTAKSQTTLDTLGYKQHIRLFGTERMRITFDCLSENPTVWYADSVDSKLADSDSLYLTILQNDLRHDTASDGTFPGKYPVWDTVYTWGPLCLDTSIFINWYTNNIDTLWGLGLYDRLAFKFNFTDYDSLGDTQVVNSGGVDSLRFHMTIEALE